MMSDADAHEGGVVPDVDPVIHAPARLAIVALLVAARSADFTFLLKQTGLTRGNLSSHLAKLEEVGYVRVDKTFVQRVPRTVMTLTPQGKAAFRRYRQRMQQALDSLPD